MEREEGGFWRERRRWILEREKKVDFGEREEGGFWREKKVDFGKVAATTKKKGNSGNDKSAFR